MKKNNKPFEKLKLSPDDRGIFIQDQGDLTNEFAQGSKGNVTLQDVGWEVAPLVPPYLTVGIESELEKLVSDLADEAGLSEVALARFLVEVGIISLAGSTTQTNDPTSVGFNIAGEIEFDNAIMEVGDIIDLGAGNDRINAKSGNDIVFGGDGEDNLRGQQGNDALFGGADDDVLDGGAGNDFLSGDGGNDVLKGGKGQDRIEGGDGADLVIAGNGGDNENIRLGASSSSTDVFSRDNFEDVVQSAASFAENGTDTVFLYSDGQKTAGAETIARDVIDLSDAFDFSSNGLTSEQREAELSEAFYVSGINLNDRGGDGSAGDAGNDNTWFILHEDADGTDVSAPPEIVTVEIDGFVFEWDVNGGDPGWSEM